MRHRGRSRALEVLGVFAVALSLVASAGAGSADEKHAAEVAQVLDVEELCNLFPQDQGFDIRWTRSDACDGTLGDCVDVENGTCVDGRILRLDSESLAAETAEEYCSPGAVSLGEPCTKAATGGQWRYLYRDRYLMFTYAVPQQDARGDQLIRHLDHELEAALAEEDPPSVEDAGDDSVSADSSPPKISAEEIGLEIMSIAFGSDETEWWLDLEDLVAERTGCRYLDVANRLAGSTKSIPDQCAEVVDRAREAIAVVEDNIESDELDKGSIANVVRAIWLSNLSDADGNELFPGMVAAEPVVLQLGRGAALGNQRAARALDRFIDLTAGRDLLGWAGTE